MKLLKFYQEWHLGDSVFHFIYMRKLLDLYPDYEIEYYVKPEYIYELKNLISNYYNIKLYPLKNIEPDMINAWLGVVYWEIPTKEKFYYNELYIRWFNYLSNKIGIENPIRSMIIDSWPEFQNVEPNKEYDILFINSQSLSGEYDSIESEDIKIMNHLTKNNRVITTKKVPGFDCTLDKNMSLLDIGKLSIGVKTLIGANTSPLILCLNNRTLDLVENVYIIAKSHGYNLNTKFHHAQNIFELERQLGI